MVNLIYSLYLFFAFGTSELDLQYTPALFETVIILKETYVCRSVDLDKIFTNERQYSNAYFAYFPYFLLGSLGQFLRYFFSCSTIDTTKNV